MLKYTWECVLQFNNIKKILITIISSFDWPRYYIIGIGVYETFQCLQADFYPDYYNKCAKVKTEYVGTLCY